jgi:hypothetical protein
MLWLLQRKVADLMVQMVVMQERIKQLERRMRPRVSNGQQPTGTGIDHNYADAI